MDPINEVCAHVNDRPAPGLTIDKIRDRGHVLDEKELETHFAKLEEALVAEARRAWARREEL
ncbi:MAG: hypothetical protein ABEK84_00350 [Salinibacter sp.]